MVESFDRKIPQFPELLIKGWGTCGYNPEFVESTANDQSGATAKPTVWVVD